jgi:aspartate 1-decarboxylase
MRSDVNWVFRFQQTRELDASPSGAGWLRGRIRSCRMQSRTMENQMRWMLRSKIHKAVVTDANLDYIGSVTIDQELIEMVGFWPGEKVLVVSNTSGARLDTYVIVGERHSGVICMNGAAAHLIRKGEEVIIMGFELTDSPIVPKSILVGPGNKFSRWL